VAIRTIFFSSVKPRKVFEKQPSFSASLDRLLLRGGLCPPRSPPAREITSPLTPECATSPLYITILIRSVFTILLDDVSLEDIAFLDIAELFEADTALVAFSNFLCVFLETLEACDLVVSDDDTVTDNTNL